jgi:hypothetical protein
MQTSLRKISDMLKAKGTETAAIDRVAETASQMLHTTEVGPEIPAETH